LDAALRLASLVVKVLAMEDKVLTGMTVEEFEQLRDAKEEMGVLAASILEREDRWTLSPLRLFDSGDN